MTTNKKEEKKAGPLLLLFGLAGLTGLLIALRKKPALPPVGTSLTGVVSDAPTGLPLPGVWVTLGSQTFYTDNSGQYLFQDLDPLTGYTATFDKLGYALLTVPDIQLQEGPNELNVALERLALPVIDQGGVSMSNSHHVLARSGKRRYATYVKSGQVMVAISDDEGETWQPHAVAAGSDPSISLDNNGDLALAYAGAGGKILYDVLSGDSWLGPQQVNDPAGDNGLSPEILTDSMNNPHVFYLSDRGRGFGEWGQAYVRHAEGPPVWTKTDIAGVGVGGGGGVDPGAYAVALNTMDGWELIWYRGTYLMGVGWSYGCIYKGSKPDVSLPYGGALDIAAIGSDIAILCGNFYLYGAALGPAEVIGLPASSMGISADGRIYITGSGAGARVSEQAEPADSFESQQRHVAGTAIFDRRRR